MTRWRQYFAGYPFVFTFPAQRFVLVRFGHLIAFQLPLGRENYRLLLLVGRSFLGGLAVIAGFAGFDLSFKF